MMSDLVSPFTVNQQGVERTSFDRIALDPQRSVVVEACAGSGKTWLLVARIMRLLLAGAKPSEILAITFTRKAAQEMRERLLQLLEQLATEEDEKVCAMLIQRGLDARQAQLALPRARSLIEIVLTASAPIVIDTFHGWFGRIVRSAPLLSGISSSLTTTERTGELVREARRLFLARVTTDAALQTHYIALLRRAGSHATEGLLRNLLRRRNEWRCYLGDTSIADALQSLADELGVDESDEDDPRLQLIKQAHFQKDYLRLNSVISRGTDTEKKRAASAIEGYTTLQQSGLDEEAFSQLLQLVKLKSKDDVQKPTRDSIKAAQDEWGSDGTEQLRLLIQKLCERLMEVINVAVERDVLALNRAALHCGEALMDAYAEVKQQAATLDFDDLEWHAAALTRQAETAAYIQTRLDARYKHLLIDEFQDTNPLQWSVLRNWLDAYGGDQARPSVFLVGDPKQSIYRFRRAEPRIFETARHFLHEHYGADVLRTNQTRRCAEPIVEALNVALLSDDYKLYDVHQTVSQAQGAVWRLPLVPYPEKNQAAADENAVVMRDALTTPLQEIESTQGDQEAAQIVQALQRLIGLRFITDENGEQRLADYRDVLLLVRKRSRINPLETALRAANMPCVSDRRGGLLATLEALDLSALLNFLVSPFNDLALAHVLRTPVFACTDDDLIFLAHSRRSLTIDDAVARPSLWEQLQSLHVQGRLEQYPALMQACSQLSEWLKLAGILPVHDLLDRIYHQGRVIERYVASVPAALRIQVRANLLACMELALELDSGRYPSLPRFIEELNDLSDADEQESPGEGLTAQGNAVRIITVHGAKGLEAPIVVLVDANNASPRNEAWSVLIDWPPEADKPTHFSVFGSKDDRGLARAPRFEIEQSLAQREDWNLLYVAATRAKEVLLISGVTPYRENKTESWYQRLQGVPEFDWSLPWKSQALDGLQADEASHDSGSNKLVIVEDFQPRPRRIGQRGVLKLDGYENAGHIEDHIDEQNEHQRLRGIALHAVLEQQADTGFNAEQAQRIARAWLPEAEAQDIAHTASRMLAAPKLRRFFDASMYLRADNELELLTADGDWMRIDRLVEFGPEQGDEVWVLDYKSQASAAMTMEYRAQLERYQRAVHTLCPERIIRTGLIFSNGELREL